MDKNKILYSELNGMQRDSVVYKIQKAIGEDLDNGNILFDYETPDNDTRVGHGIKGIKWTLTLEIIR